MSVLKPRVSKLLPLFATVGLNIIAATHNIFPDDLLRIVLDYCADSGPVSAWTVIYTCYHENQREAPRAIGTFLSYSSAVHAVLEHIDPNQLASFEWSKDAVPRTVTAVFGDEYVNFDSVKVRERILQLNFSDATSLIDAINDHEWQANDLHGSCGYDLAPTNIVC
jgi:hypothetical protein